MATLLNPLVGKCEDLLSKPVNIIWSNFYHNLKSLILNERCSNFVVGGRGPGGSRKGPGCFTEGARLVTEGVRPNINRREFTLRFLYSSINFCTTGSISVL